MTNSKYQSIHVIPKSALMTPSPPSNLQHSLPSFAPNSATEKYKIVDQNKTEVKERMISDFGFGNFSIQNKSQNQTPLKKQEEHEDCEVSDHDDEITPNHKLSLVTRKDPLKP